MAGFKIPTSHEGRDKHQRQVEAALKSLKRAIFDAVTAGYQTDFWSRKASAAGGLSVTDQQMSGLQAFVTVSDHVLPFDPEEPGAGLRWLEERARESGYTGPPLWQPSKATG